MILTFEDLPKSLLDKMNFSIFGTGLTSDFPRVYSVLHQVVHVVIRKYLLFFGFVTVRVDAAQVRCANPLSTGANAEIKYSFTV